MRSAGGGQGPPRSLAVGRRRANGELAAPVTHAALRVSIVGRKTTVPMMVSGAHCVPFHRLRTPPRKLLCRIHAACARLGEANFGCARPTGPGGRPPKSGTPRIDLEHNVMALR